MNRIECPECGHQNSPYHSTCFKCDSSLKNVAVNDKVTTSSLDKSLVITFKALVCAVLFAAVWFFFLAWPIFELPFGPIDFELFLFVIFFGTIVAATPGVFLGAALSDYGFRRSQNMKGRRHLNWGAATMATLGFITGVLLAFALFFILQLDIGGYGIVGLPVVALFISVYIYVDRTSP